MISATLRFFHLLALVVWIGAIVFFSFIVAPTLFGALPRDLAGRATSAIFPRYYLLGTVCGAVALATAIPAVIRDRARIRPALIRITLLLLMTLFTVYAGNVILPEASALRPSMNEAVAMAERGPARARFATLHRRSVLLNGVVLLLGLGALLTLVPQEPGRQARLMPPTRDDPGSLGQ